MKFHTFAKPQTLAEIFMENSSIYKAERWEVLWFIISILGLVAILYPEFNGSNCYDHHPVLFSSLIGLVTCVITAILVLYLQRVSKNKGLFNYYFPIAGNYIRTDIGQDNTPEEGLEKLRTQNIGLKISLIYVGGNKFNADMEYWKNDNAKATGIFEFNETNKVFASGTYKYYQGELHKEHFGTLELFRFEEEPNKIYVKYQHVFPRKPQNNPDANRGWQIWEKNIR